MRLFWALLLAAGLTASQAAGTLRACACKTDCAKKCCPSPQKDACKVSFASADQALSDATSIPSVSLWVLADTFQPVPFTGITLHRSVLLEKSPPRIRAPEQRAHSLRAPPYLA
ncbi:MAG: hypothetical protein D6724_00030 [Armatimonadetes bacterium]|nr:MAG: hypothetical protein D6724_00030 [Armatimonadota bacterium]